eukprot:8207401-Ditylum_brightwellii.AAC.1
MADLANSPLSNKQEVDLGNIILPKTGKFNSSLTAWNALNLAKQTWAAFQVHFHDAQKVLKKT